jgi:hypothetical protein
MKFFVTAELQTGNLEAVLSAIYELYTDFVLKVSLQIWRYIYVINSFHSAA